MSNVILSLRFQLGDYTKFKFLNIDNRKFVNFTNKWLPPQNSANAKKYNQNTQENTFIKKTNNTLLITLLSLVFEETSNLSSNRSHLYKETLNNLLKKWDKNHTVERDQVYKNLSLQQKQNLLSYIALKTFEQGKYLFRQRELEQYIANYICNLGDPKTDPKVLQLNSKAVLKSIEAQHGILVEQEKGIYSFSVLAFHEYLTAKEIIDSPNPQASEQALQNLVSHVSETHWREVFLLAVSMLRNADYFLILIKHRTNSLVASDQALQHFLAWINEKSRDNCPYKPSAFRAFSIEFLLDLDFDFACNLDNSLAHDLGCNSAPIYNHTHELQDFQFNERQKKVLKQYYDVNKLLLDCLNNAHYVNRSLRKEIEDTLLVKSEISQCLYV